MEAAHVFEVLEEATLLVDLSLLKWPLQKLEDLGHAILDVEFVHTEVFKFLFRFTAQTIVQQERLIFSRGKWPHLQLPDLNLLLVLGEGPQVTGIILPQWDRWILTGLPLDPRLRTFSAIPRSSSLVGVIVLLLLPTSEAHVGAM